MEIEASERSESRIAVSRFIEIPPDVRAVSNGIQSEIQFKLVSYAITFGEEL